MKGSHELLDRKWLFQQNGPWQTNFIINSNHLIKKKHLENFKEDYKKTLKKKNEFVYNIFYYFSVFFLTKPFW